MRMSNAQGITFKLEELLQEIGITKNALAREAKIRPNTIYEMCSNTTKRIEFKTFNTVMETLIRLSGRQLTLHDVLEYTPEDEAREY
ncbi:helix-turn-helix domain-containing protein [Paenibacillus sp. 8b26]|uniref:helix-turn-helix domain-containing protein n=1 Tax=Paenibacillus sp. 8b26 TaxID=3424133 RepID=UPI003D65A6B4